MAAAGPLATPEQRKIAQRSLSILSGKTAADRMQTVNLPDTTNDMSGTVRGGQALVRMLEDGTVEQVPMGPQAAASAIPAGALAEFRQRLVTELALDAAQQQKVDAIYTAARPEFGKLRELPEDQRAKARERVLADIRAQVGDVLTPEQRPKYAALVAESAGRVSVLDVSGDRAEVTTVSEAGHPTGVDVHEGVAWYVEAHLSVLFEPENAPAPVLPFRLIPVALPR